MQYIKNQFSSERKMRKITGILGFLLLSANLYAMAPAITHSIPIDDLPKFNSYSPTVKTLIHDANSLIQKNLTYLYGSADPANKGMDCSGTIYYLLKKSGISDIPRQSNEIYIWAEKNGKMYTIKNQEFNTEEMSHLRPGDLLFWSGTYAVKHVPDITHVMIYLGLNSENKPIMFGASDGRTYQNKKMWGVSVFDFKLSNGRSAKFAGYSCIPHLTCDLNEKQKK
jgi:hypothetical protein